MQADDSLPSIMQAKSKQVNILLLVARGKQDNLIPMEHGEATYNNSPTDDKQLVVISGAGHNNLMAIGFVSYFSAIAEFVNNHLD